MLSVTRASSDVGKRLEFVLYIVLLAKPENRKLRFYENIDW